MRVLSAEEVAEWFQGFENVGVYSDYVYADKDELFFTHPEAACINVEYPPKLAVCLTSLLPERSDFHAHVLRESS